MARDHLPDNLGLPSDAGTFRTVMAANRTLMAWVRTALSMYSFGFTIYKLLEGAGGGQAITGAGSPQRAGMVLVAMGTAAMVLGVASYWVTLVDLRRTGEFRLGRPALLMALLMMLGGGVLFLAILRRAV